MLFNSYEFIFLFLPITFFRIFFLEQKAPYRSGERLFGAIVAIFLQLVEYRVSTFDSCFHDI